MYRLALIAIAVCAIAISTVPRTTKAAPPPPSNISSHLPEFFRDLLTDRVYVYKRREAPAAMYFAKDGTYYACWLHSDGRYVRVHDDATWTIGTSRGRSNYRGRTYHPRTGENIITRNLIYIPDTGRFLFETTSFKNRSKTDRTWNIARDGWIQDSWPQILFDDCPDLRLPDGFPVNARQTSLNFDAVKENADPIRNHPGSNLRFPGATGLGASSGAPTLTPDEVHAAFRSLDRKISIDTRGSKLVYLRRLDDTEVWNLDKRMNVMDIGIMRLNPYTSTFITDWQRSGNKARFRFGYPLPVQPTERLHPIFPMMNTVVSRQRPVSIPGANGAKIDHSFDSTGTVRTPGRAGTWRISAGKVEVTFDHRTHAYPWRVFAKFAGWKSR